MPKQERLSEHEKAVLAEYQQGIRDIQQQIQGTLRLALRARGLQGNWTLDGDVLVEQKA